LTNEVHFRTEKFFHITCHAAPDAQTCELIVAIPEHYYARLGDSQLVQSLN
jgi:hypothetical protein